MREGHRSEGEEGRTWQVLNDKVDKERMSGSLCQTWILSPEYPVPESTWSAWSLAPHPCCSRAPRLPAQAWPSVSFNPSVQTQPALVLWLVWPNALRVDRSQVENRSQSSGKPTPSSHTIHASGPNSSCVFFFVKAMRAVTNPAGKAQMPVQK